MRGRDCEFEDGRRDELGASICTIAPRQRDAIGLYAASLRSLVIGTSTGAQGFQASTQQVVGVGQFLLDLLGVHHRLSSPPMVGSPLTGTSFPRRLCLETVGVSKTIRSCR